MYLYFCTISATASVSTVAGSGLEEFKEGRGVEASFNHPHEFGAGSRGKHSRGRLLRIIAFDESVMQKVFHFSPFLFRFEFCF